MIKSPMCSFLLTGSALFQIMVFIISINFPPSDGFNGEPDLLSLSDQTISAKLKSHRIWTEGTLND